MLDLKLGKELENKINTNWEIAETYQNRKSEKRKTNPYCELRVRRKIKAMFGTPRAWGKENIEEKSKEGKR